MNTTLATPQICPTRWSITRDSAPEPLVVCCVYYGSKYPVEYVLKLKNSVKRNLPLAHEFVCLSDREIEGIKTLPLPQLSKGVEGWWQKINLFQPGIFADGTRVLYLDLDVVVTGDLSVLAKQWAAEPLSMIFNFGPNRSHCAHNSSVMLWSANDERLMPIWLEYQNNSVLIMNRLHGDQCWIWRVLRDDVANFPRDYVVSYKYDCRGQHVDPQVRVVVFHGNPKPKDCREDWVVKNWV